MEPAAAELGERLQFERQGYFFRDPVDSRPDRLVWNRIVPLRDSWALEVQKQAPAPAAPEKPKSPAPKPPRETEAKAPEPLSAEEQKLIEELRPTVQPIVDAVIAAHPTEAERYRSGKTGILGFLVAQVMKRVAEGGGKANPKLISVMLTEALRS